MVVGEKEIKEVKEVTYLGYRFKWSGGQEAQIEERVRKAMGAGVGNRQEEIWQGLGKKNKNVRLVGGECNWICGGSMEVEGMEES